MARLINTTKLNSLLRQFLALFILLAPLSNPVKAVNNDEIFQVVRLINEGQYPKAIEKLPDIVANTDKVNSWGGPLGRAIYMLYLADVAIDGLGIIMTPEQITKAQKLARECIKKNYKNCG
jgi:hypothetical protein